MFVTLTNFSLEAPLKVNLNLGRVGAREARGIVLTHADRQATNTWARPDEVVPASFDVQVTSTGAAFEMPKQSIISIDFELAA